MSAEAPRLERARIVLPHFTRSIVTRSLLAWAFVRVAVTAAMRGAEAAVGLSPGNPLRLTPVAALLVIAVVAVVGWASARRRNQDTFLLCLGYGRARQLATIAAPTALLELLIAMMVRAR